MATERTINPITLPEPFIKKILQREMVRNIARSLAEQPSPFQNNESLVIIGSAAPTIEGFTHTDAMPLSKVPTDIDIMLYEPKGEAGGPQSGLPHADRFTRKNSNHNKLENVVRSAANSINARLWKRPKEGVEESSETVANQKYNLQKTWSAEEITRVLQSDSTKQLLRKLHNKPADTVLEIAPYNQSMEIVTEIHMLGYPLSFLPPRPLAGAPHTDTNKIQLMADDDLNVVALKLVRLMLPGASRSIANHTLKSTDLIDIHDILRQRRARQEPALDPEMLRILVLSHLSSQKTTDVNKASVAKLAPDKMNVQSMYQDFKDQNIHLPLSGVETMLKEVHGMLEKVFPTVSPTNPLPLTDDDKAFIGLIKGTLTDEQKNVHPVLLGNILENGRKKQYRFSRPHLAAHRLRADRPEEMAKVLDKYPDFIERLAQNWIVRPLDGTMDDTVRAGGFITK